MSGKLYTIVLTEAEVQALGRAIDDLPKRAWDGFTVTAKPCLDSINRQLQMPPPMPAVNSDAMPPSAAPPGPLANGHADQSNGMSAATPHME